MKKILLCTALVWIASLGTINAQQADAARIAELDRYWVELSRTVEEGDFEGYGAGYHEDAVVVFATGEAKRSMAISSALEGWKQGFMDTKAGKEKNQVEFRFSQRIGDDNTAHETGIFHYTSYDKSGKALADALIHFEMLLIKRDGTWLGMMEYQKSEATQTEWDALKK